MRVPHGDRHRHDRGQVATTFNGMFVSDPMASVLKMFTYIAVALCLVYSRVYMAERGLYRGEYFVLALFATLGMMVMISANHFLTLYLGLELMSLCLYSLVALNRDSAVSSEAAMKYFVLGAIASGLLLYGMSMIYGARARSRSPRSPGARPASCRATILRRPCWLSGWCSSYRASRSRWAWCRSTCGSPTCTTARLRR